MILVRGRRTSLDSSSSLPLLLLPPSAIGGNQEFERVPRSLLDVIYRMF